MRLSIFTTPALRLALAACGGAPSGNELRLDDDGNGQFSGTAGNQWTPTEIIAQACGPNQTATAFRTIAADAGSGAFAFAGRCNAGVTTSVPGTQNVQILTPTAQPALLPAPQTVQQSAPNGSTYVSPFATGYTPPQGFYNR